MVDIRYDVPIEVSRVQYRRVVSRFGQLIAHRVDSRGRYWVKLWVMEFREELEAELNK